MYLYNILVMYLKKEKIRVKYFLIIYMMEKIQFLVIMPIKKEEEEL